MSLLSPVPGPIVALLLFVAAACVAVVMWALSRRQRVTRDLPKCPNCNKPLKKLLLISTVDPASKKGNTEGFCPHCNYHMSSALTELNLKTFEEFTKRVPR